MKIFLRADSVDIDILQSHVTIRFMSIVILRIQRCRIVEIAYVKSDDL